MIKLDVCIEKNGAFEWYDVTTQEGRAGAFGFVGDDGIYSVVDYDSNVFTLDEYTSLEDIAEVMGRANALEPHEIGVFIDIASAQLYEPMDVIDIVEDGRYIISNEEVVSAGEALAYALVDDGVINFGGDSIIEQYFDFESFGRDLLLNGEYMDIETDTGWIFIYE